MATSKAPEDIALVLEIMVPGAKASTARNVIATADIIVLALPLSKYRSLSPELLAGKIVVDAMNYWAPTDGTIAEFEGGRSSSMVVQDFLSGARLVRSFNHMGYHEIDEEARPAGDPERRALAVAGNDAEARREVACFIDRIGFDPVDAGPLAFSRSFETGTPLFGATVSRADMERAFGLQRAG
ncbi:hypothetical protein FHS76_000630 [Ochrobactrum daejeonense]|uniref:Pyrroline-5-carboxylate reductase catalytic N-terminal domain-containing protein n=1 Tax=Brucella daejeonensis TaxID=659015 RepID=A0A7W9AUF9_9HYPH|nr:hypothetical protein [Brucella daejeonensis]